MKSKATLLNIGWLEPGILFRTGVLPSDVAQKITTATASLRNPMRGIQGCLFCDNQHIFERINGTQLLLGMSEVWLPSPQREIIYIAPSLLIHYINRHEYLPPEQVISDIAALPSSEEQWDTPSGAFKRLIKRYKE